MKRSHFSGRKDFFDQLSDVTNPQQILGKMFADLEHWLKPQWFHNVLEQMNHQISVEETSDAYLVTVYLDGIEHPNDISVKFRNGHLHLRRTVQFETKTDKDAGAIWQSYYEHFERTLPIAKPIVWKEHQILAQKGIWKIKLPKQI